MNERPDWFGFLWIGLLLFAGVSFLLDFTLGVGVLSTWVHPGAYHCTQYVTVQGGQVCVAGH